MGGETFGDSDGEKRLPNPSVHAKAKQPKSGHHLPPSEFRWRRLFDHAQHVPDSSTTVESFPATADPETGEQGLL